MRRRPARDLWMAAAAVPLVAAAQRAREVPLPDLVTVLTARPAPSSPDVRRALSAASRASRLLHGLTGALDSCLIRSLVAGRMLAPHHEVRLVTGFRPGRDGAHAEGHAWLEVDGEPLQVSPPPEGPPFERAHSIAFPGSGRETAG